MKRAILAMAAMFLMAFTTAATALDTTTVTVTASVTGTCKFVSPSATLDFTALDPSSAGDATAQTTVGFWCTRGATAGITDDDGLYPTGTVHRMRHATDATEFIPYSFTYSSPSLVGTGPGTPITLTIDGFIANSDYVNALAGNYSDTVVVSINP